MKKEFIGYLSVILSGMLLSLELYGLNFIKHIDVEINGSCYTNTMEYIYKAPISLAFLITISIVILGFILIIQSKKGN